MELVSWKMERNLERKREKREVKLIEEMRFCLPTAPHNGFNFSFTFQQFPYIRNCKSHSYIHTSNYTLNNQTHHKRRSP